MLKNKDYCDCETCAALSELGCPVPKYATLNIHTKEKEWKMWLPLYDAQKWLREEHQIHIEITYTPACWTGKIYDLKEWDYIKGFTFFESFEDALHTLIKEAVKILKNQ